MDVLLVEDEAVIRMVLADDMADAGLDVIETCNAEDALAAVSSASPDDKPSILVTDINLGQGMNGLALIAELRRRWPNVGVVIMTGLPTNLAQHQADRNEVWLFKPFDPSMVTAAVHELICRAHRRADGPGQDA